LPGRCEVCHQSDQYDPQRNICERCHEVCLPVIQKPDDKPSRFMDVISCAPRAILVTLFVCFVALVISDWQMAEILFIIYAPYAITLILLCWLIELGSKILSWYRNRKT